MADAGEPGAHDRYYQGSILRLHPGSRTGVVRTDHGRDVPFDARHVQIIGAAQGFGALAPGQRVGFDLGRTSHGLCVTTIRVYEPA